MNLETISGAAAIALACTLLFVLLTATWHALFTALSSRTKFPESIMLEAAQRFRDDLDRLRYQQAKLLSAALVFVVIFGFAGVSGSQQLVGELSIWQLVPLLTLLAIVICYGIYRVIVLARRQRQLGFIRDTSMAVGHGLHNLVSNQNRVFHDVPCNSSVLDHVLVGTNGVYAVHVIVRRPGNDRRVRLQGSKLAFAPGDTTLSLLEYGRRSERLARDCRKTLNQGITVRSVIAVPGWEVDSQSSEEFLLVNERQLSMIGGWKDPKEFLLNEDVESIQSMLTERCKRFS
jgi:hypothetical protein